MALVVGLHMNCLSQIVFDLTSLEIHTDDIIETVVELFCKRFGTNGFKITLQLLISRTHASRDAIFLGQNLLRNSQKFNITLCPGAFQTSTAGIT